MNNILSNGDEIKWGQNPHTYERSNCFRNYLHNPEKVRTSMAFEPVTLWCWDDALTSSGWSMMLGAGHFWVQTFPWEMNQWTNWSKKRVHFIKWIHCIKFKAKYSARPVNKTLFILSFRILSTPVLKNNPILIDPLLWKEKKEYGNILLSFQSFPY